MYITNLQSNQDPDFIFLGLELWPGLYFKLVNMNTDINPVQDKYMQ